MAESCGGNWWNLPENPFGRSPCSSGPTDIPSFDWPYHGDMVLIENKGTRSSDDSSGGFSSSTTPNDWNQELFFSNYGGGSEDDPSNMISPEIPPPPEQYPSNPISTSGEIFPLDSATTLLLQTLFDMDDSEQPPHGFLPTFPPPFPDFILPTTTQSQLSFPPSHTKKRNEEASRIGQKKPDNLKPGLKRARIQTPSPLPTFNVRKEKLGDRVTALQQLVSPFGKTDTASVLQEAIEYIRFLHDQVNVLSSPRLKKVPGQEGLVPDLRGRGLCLVPISKAFPVISETTVDFWTPVFREGSFK